MQLKKLDYVNDNGYEILAAAGTIQGHARKIVVIARYMPPKLHCATCQRVSGLHS